ncbi:sensor domain-containing protein [Parahaliea mediterranea]|uniref:sensor domain-containing protein n=1 Tax=Parahaliea mediterranea TaxID=651086 RepID=UPI000E2F383F|nr:EAL domain-containing protein [Parahaliea mediterranea]
MAHRAPSSSAFSNLREDPLVSVIIESLPGMFYVFDVNGRMLLWNQRLCELTGYSPGDIEHLHPLDLFEDRAYMAGRIREVFERGSNELEGSLVRRNGETVLVRFSSKLVDINGQQCVAGLGVDVSDRQRIEEILHDSEARYRSFIENTTEGVYSFEVERPVPVETPVSEQIQQVYNGRIVACNDAMAQMYGYTHAADLVGVKIRDLHAGEDRPQNRAFLQAWIENGYHIVNAESLEVGRDGKPLWFANNCVGIVENGCLVRGWGAQIDISERKSAEQRLRLSASVFENIADGIFITNADYTIVDVNQAFVDITGYGKAEVIGKDTRLLQSGRHDDAFFLELQHTLGERGSWRGEVWYRRKDGEIFPVLLTVSAVENDDAVLTHYVCAATDISQIKQSQERLDYLAHHDPLTGLANRALLVERLEWSMQHARRNQHAFALVFIDLDHFKHVNDSMGHPAGDELLQAVARRLVNALREEDTVARLGGDEFVLILEQIPDANVAARLVEKLLKALAEPFRIEGRDIHVLASMGICLYPGDGDDTQTLLRNADAALFRAKERGRNTFEFYTEELTRNALARVLLESNLRRALAENQLALHYQPQIDLDTGAVVGIEALVRWHHPEQGLMLPGSFIPLAEETGLIHDIGEWVLRQACRQAQLWRTAGLTFGRVGVNVSRAQLQRGRLFEEIQQVLADTGLAAHHLELEVTESFIMAQERLAIRQLDRLFGSGVSIAIDDFGTGYSSLSYLKRLPVHRLKIDKTFIQDIPGDENDVAITAAVISMAHKLGLNVLAEGVESAEQAAFLRESGCREAQGFLYARPLDAAAATAFLRARRAG